MHTLSFIVFQVYFIISGQINFIAVTIVFLSLSVISGVICFVNSRKGKLNDELA